MMYRKSILGNASVYTVTNLLNAGIPFLLLPVLTRFLTPEDYGTVSMFTVLVTLFTFLVGLNSAGSVGRQYFEKDKSDFPRYVSSSFILVACSCSIMLVLALTCAGQIENVSGFPGDFLWMVIFAALANSIIALMLTLLQMQGRVYLYGFFQLVMTLMVMGLSLLLVVSFKMGWFGRASGQLASVAFMSCVALFLMRRCGFLVWRWNRADLHHLLDFGLPLVIHSISGFLALQMIDKLMLVNLMGLDSVGFYFVGAQVGMIVGITQDAFNKAWVPWFYERLNSRDASVNSKIVKYTYAYMAMIILLALLVGALSPLIFKLLLPEAYSAGLPVVIWIAVTFAFNGVYKMFANYLFYHRRTRRIAAISLSSAVVNVVLSYYLIQINGLAGAAQGTMLAALYSLVMTWFVAQKVHPMPWLSINQNQK